MICKYCGRLVTAKNKCLCCGTSQKGSSAVKLTPQQKAEYEALQKQREEETLKLEQERIENEKKMQQKHKELVAKIMSFVGIGFSVIAVILLIIKATFIGNVTVANYNSVVNGGYEIEKAVFIFGIGAGAIFLATAIAKKKAGKKAILWVLLIAVLPVTFIININARCEAYGEINVISGLKEEYVVGETIDYSSLKLEVNWQDFEGETIKKEEIDLSKFTVKRVTTWPETWEIGVIYIKDNGTNEATSSTQKRDVTFRILLYTTEYGYENTLRGEWRYAVVNAQP